MISDPAFKCVCSECETQTLVELESVVLSDAPLVKFFPPTTNSVIKILKERGWDVGLDQIWCTSCKNNS